MTKNAKQLKITLVKSGIGRPERQKNTLIGLGLTKVNRTVIRDDTPSNRGMVNKVSHLVLVEAI
ncbi:MAG: 50S ribosomal protein L30 [Deltaproteobacteria bacterium]|uniref:50S ribosomal protein L30 n=1 Tax=uncultured delta proteobacterium Rifle_16ft_4_minimus_809 TaxID=1665185 RepID=A0A0H4TD64_9DELT|nr:50S ribosomal protein L30, large subunit ribosomal protein L30 [uncultured delta proteobacterium Rifle_16ft_4_minimus_809]